jgi:hypothetical protein
MVGNHPDEPCEMCGVQHTHVDVMRRELERPPAAGTLVVRRDWGNMTTRWHCLICDGSTDKTDQPYTFTDENGKAARVCDRCAEAGPEGIPAILLSTAASLRMHADRLTFLAREARWEVHESREYDYYAAAGYHPITDGPDQPPF